MDKNDMQILVVPCDKLFATTYFQGFSPASATDYETRILANRTYMRRGDAEQNPAFKQPIAYALIANREIGKAFAFRRAGKHDEARLKDKWSLGIGGHIEKLDHAENPIYASFLRETEEEVHIHGNILGARVLGYVNDDTNEVGKVHLGILYLIETDAQVVLPRDPEIAEGSLHDLSEIEAILSDERNDVETWSRIAFPQLRELMR